VYNPKGDIMADISGIFQQMLGRAPTGEENMYFNDLIQKGELSPYQLNYFLQGTPEYQQIASQKSIQEVQRSQQAYDEVMFPKMQEQAISRFAKMGRPGSSGLESTVAIEQANLARERGMQTAGMVRQDAQSRMGYGQQVAGTAQQQLYGRQEQRAQYEQQLEMQRRQAEYQKLENERQQSFYQSQQPSFLEGLTTAVIPAAASIFGAKLGAPKSTTNYNLQSYKPQGYTGMGSKNYSGGY